MYHVTKRSYIPESDTRNYNHNGTTHYRTTDFVNLTPHQVVILDRQNIPVVLPAAPPDTLMNPPRVEIRTHYQFFNTDAIRLVSSALGFMNTQLASISEERKIFTDVLTAGQADIHKGHTSFTAVRKIPLEDIQSSSALFDQASGFVITINNAHLTTAHPESMEGRMAGNHEEFVKSRPVGFLIEIVDNENMIKERFTYACNSVIRIPAIKDINRISGIYASMVKDVGQSVSVTDTKHYTLSEAEKKFGLYCTKEEAQTNGNPELIARNLVEMAKTELENVKAKAAQSEAENRQLESDYKRKLIAVETEHKTKWLTLEMDQKAKLLNMETENKEKTAEILRLKEEIDKRKLVREEYYESRSSERKDTSEIVKFIPAVLMGFIGAAILFRK